MGCELPSYFWSPPTADCRLPTAYCLLLTAYCILLTAFCFRGAGGTLGPYGSIRQDVILAGEEGTLVTLKIDGATRECC